MAKIPTNNYVTYYDPNKAHHRAWLQAVLDRLTEYDPKALSEGHLRELWVSAVETKPPAYTDPTTMKLDVAYEYQNDNDSGTGYRECFSSSCAMIARYWGKVKDDDEYNKIRAKYGDSTSSDAQVKALRSLGLTPRFITNGNASLLETEIRLGRPVAVGWLHKGPVTAPTGGGHWSVCIGFSPTTFVFNDPNGEADMVNGGYVNHTRGAGVNYSRLNFTRRWEADGPNTGWAIVVHG